MACARRAASYCAMERINITLCGDGGCGAFNTLAPHGTPGSATESYEQANRPSRCVWFAANGPTSTHALPSPHAIAAPPPTMRVLTLPAPHRYDPTIEDSYSVTRTVDGRPYLLALTDTAGQEEYRALQSSYARNADAFLLVYDITSPASLHAQLPYFMDLIRMEAEARQDAGRVTPIVLVAGNKCDLQEERRVSAREGLEWARSRGCGFMETSARECVNVEETFAREPAPSLTALVGKALLVCGADLDFATLVLVRRVLEARRQHAMPPPPPAPARAHVAQPRQKGRATAHEPGASFSRTEPLAPPAPNEKAVSTGHAPGRRPKGRIRTWLGRLWCG